MSTRPYTNKGIGDEGEKLVAAKFRKVGILVEKMPVNYPGYDLIATPNNRKPQRISVKSRGVTNINIQPEKFDWLAVVFKEPRRFFIFPRSAAIKHSVACNNVGWEPGFRRLSIRQIPVLLARYENNFQLIARPKSFPQSK